MSKLVLVVDNDPDIADIVCELLRGEGHRTVTARDGQEALEVLAREKPAAVVLDLKMPVMDGVEMLRRLRAQPALAETPVVVLTATQMAQELEEQLRRLRVQCWISKPFEAEEVVAAVKSALKDHD